MRKEYDFTKGIRGQSVPVEEYLVLQRRLEEVEVFARFVFQKTQPSTAWSRKDFDILHKEAQAFLSHTQSEWVMVRRDILDRIKEHQETKDVPGAQAFNNGLALAAHIVKAALEPKP